MGTPALEAQLEIDMVYALEDDPFAEDNWGPGEDEPYDDDPECTRSDVGV